ncbi:MAG: helix-turn-helix transcriptional regulator [Oscillospiraceae bacterium]|nr:helix-turn-helix transcriptional regulator [Oscillospiraceae bacterium]
MRDIGKNIRQLRLHRNMTQDELAEKLFVTRQTVSNYETGKSRPDVDMLVRISEVLGTDIQQLIYGPEPKQLKPEVIRLIVGGALTALLGILWLVLRPIAQDRQRIEFELGLTYMIYLVIRPLFFILAGWALAHLLGMALRKKPLGGKWVRRAGAVLLALVVVWFVLLIWDSCAVMVNEWQYEHHIRGEWVAHEVEYDGEKSISMGWSPLPPQVPAWVEWITAKPAYYMVRYPALFCGLYILTGAALWLFGVPDGRRKGTM